MPMIRTRATIDAGGTLTLQVPPEIPPGEHEVTVIITEAAEPDDPPIRYRPPSAEHAALGIAGYIDMPGSILDGLPVYDRGPWPEGETFRREDMYDDWGR